MDRPWFYDIRVEGQLTDSWTDWFAGLAIQSGADSMTILCGFLPDQAALLGVLNKLHALNLSLISVTRVVQMKEGAG